MSSFALLGIPAYLTDALTDLGIEHPTPIQTATVPDALAARDVLGRGRTGSGKTYAFLLPVVARLAGGRTARSTAPRALILAPTRELVSQIDAALAPLARAAGLSHQTVFGGVGQGPQVTALRRGLDIVVATPGRLEDLIGQGHCRLDAIEITVLDEADHMSDLGFLPVVRRLLSATPRRSQRLLFSATLDGAVNALVRQFLSNPITHEVDPVGSSSEGAMAHHVLHIDHEHRLAILVDLASAPGRTVVFTRTKHGAKALARQLNRSGVPTVELHGNLGQNARTRNLDDFHAGRASTLVATDIAARGIHVDNVNLVVHADPPTEHKAYLHRSGRTARAGNSGTVITLATSPQLQDVRGLTKAAGITPRTTRLRGGSHPVLLELAPGVRELPGALRTEAPPAPANGSGLPASRPDRGRRRGQQQGRRADGASPEVATTRRGTSSGQTPNGARGPRGARGTAAARPARSTSSARHTAASFSAGRR